MALDHYVSQVHLKRFYSPSLGNRLYAVHKRTLFECTPRAKDICRLSEGNTNRFLKNPREIELFLKQVEPKYNEAVADLASGKPSLKSILTISRFIAYITSCAPAAMRVDSGPLKEVVQITGKLLDAQGCLLKPPPELKAESFTELVESGDVEVNVDPKYPQAIGIAQISDTALAFANFSWEIITNEIMDSPFFTSDFPIAIEPTSDPTIVNRVVPLTPEIAVRLRPDPKLRYDKRLFAPDLQHLRVKSHVGSRNEILSINRLIVRCAENEVYFRDKLSWVLPFIRKNRNFRIENRTSTRKTHRGIELFVMKKIVEIRNDGQTASN